MSTIYIATFVPPPFSGHYMPQYTQDIILTGATGIVGSHILYELLHQHLQGLRSGKLIVLVRTSPRQPSAQQRVVDVLSRYRLPSYLQDILPEDLLSLVTVCTYDLRSSTADLLSSIPTDCHLIHCAATTNLGSDTAAESENRTVNYLGSCELLVQYRDRLSKYTYISTVYAAGIRTGTIGDSYQDLTDVRHRNAYEHYKLHTEHELRRLCTSAGIAYQVLRPGVVVGRLLDTPRYFLPRYNVIYAYAAFFQKLSRRGVTQHFSVPVHAESTLHLVPVDYVAKAVIAALHTPISELNIVPAVGCPVQESIATMLSIVGYPHYSFVDQLAAPTDRLQRAYQEKVVSSFGKYIQDAPYTFDNSQLLSLMAETPMPEVRSAFGALIQYAADRSFAAV